MSEHSDNYHNLFAVSDDWPMGCQTFKIYNNTFTPEDLDDIAILYKKITILNPNSKQMILPSTFGSSLKQQNQYEKKNTQCLANKDSDLSIFPTPIPVLGKKARLEVDIGYMKEFGFFDAYTLNDVRIFDEDLKFFQNSLDTNARHFPDFQNEASKMRVPNYLY